jgi:5'-nucleotidase
VRRTVLDAQERAMSALARILVANDDGVDAPGLARLADAARTLGGEVTVVAPERKWTAASHQHSFDRDLALTLRGDGVYACSGAPADCVIAAMTIVHGTAHRPDLVLSGINDKLNAGEDLAYSGTMAIAREAALWGVPAIALSSDFPVATDAVPALADLLRRLWDARTAWQGPGCWLALDLPSRLPAPLAQARVGRDKIGSATTILARTSGRIVFRLARGRQGTSTPGDERDVLSRGAIAVTRHRWDAATPLSDEALAALDAAPR